VTLATIGVPSWTWGTSACRSERNWNKPCARTRVLVPHSSGHTRFLGVMESNEMLARWFINDSMKTAPTRSSATGEDDFWLHAGAVSPVRSR
jgi:hypothetical protein